MLASADISVRIHHETAKLLRSLSGSACGGQLSSQDLVCPWVSSVPRVSVTERTSLVAGRSTGKCISPGDRPAAVPSVAGSACEGQLSS